uniref:Ig-like domain-containing protein n=1 Tax=Lates calcarifer TaxID=8187 RepID=A0A4W6C0I7_LATCA
SSGTSQLNCLQRRLSCPQMLLLLTHFNVFSRGIKGKDASLHCEMYGTPPFQVNWYKDKRPLKESRKFKMVSEGSSATLHIMKLEQDDAGLYECRVSNNVASESCRTTITLKGYDRSRFVEIQTLLHCH